jgi:anti-sigma factor RsiW
MSGMDAHPETAFVPYLRGDLAPEERARVAAHLAECAACRGALADTGAVLTALAEAPAPPEPHWGRYAAELRGRLASRRRVLAWRKRALPLAAAGLAAALVVLTLRPAPVESPANLTPLEETALGARLDMLKHYEVVQRLDMLDDMDTVRQLDVIPVGAR